MRSFVDWSKPRRSRGIAPMRAVTRLQRMGAVMRNGCLRYAMRRTPTRTAARLRPKMRTVKHVDAMADMLALVCASERAPA